MIAISRFPCMLSWFTDANSRSISSLERNVTSRSGGFMRSRTVGSRDFTCSFFRYLSHERRVIMCAFTVFTERPLSTSERRHSSISSFITHSISRGKISMSAFKSLRFSSLSWSLFGRKEKWFTPCGIWDCFFGSRNWMKRQIWNAYCSRVFGLRPLWMRR